MARRGKSLFAFYLVLLIVSFKLENLFEGFLKRSGYFEREYRRGNKLARLYGIDSLAANATLFGQLLLGDTTLGSLYSDSILHS